MQRARRTRILAALLVVPAFWPASTHAAEVIKVEIAKLAFAPAEITAHVGDTVEWTNHDFIDHTATARSGEFDLTIARNKSAQTVLKRAGSIDYYCRFHPNMKGRIAVTP